MFRFWEAENLMPEYGPLCRWQENPLSMVASRVNLPSPWTFPIEAMASISIPATAALTTANRSIPLLCSVCPDTPNFSDVSHLLTHIASKGHLHHETQTRLKSHQDLSASLALQRYEIWYKEHGIEALLVDRLKAKQVKEAARRKRTRPSAPIVPVKPVKRKAKRPSDATLTEPVIKTEDDGLPDLSELPRQLCSPDNDTEDIFATGDALSLKGQVWPGMGKMDLANEEMKRTRNQRKPKSVIDKMRRTSEGIEPNQVVMTSELEIERIKDVYDEASSPIPGQEESTPPRRVAKPKRKRSEPLSEISVNVQRGAAGLNSRKHNSRFTKGTKRSPDSENEDESSFGFSSAWGSHQNGRKLFHDNNAIPSPFDDCVYTSPRHREHKFARLNVERIWTDTYIHRFDIREPMNMAAPNPISHSNIGSPSMNSRNNHGHVSGREPHRERCQGQFFAGRGGLGPFEHVDTSLSFSENPVYNTSVRIPQISTSSFSNPNHEAFRVPSTGHGQIKQEDYPCSFGENSGLNPTQSYLHISSNPLLSQDQTFLDPFGQPTSTQPLNCLGFTPINRVHDRKYTQDHSQRLDLFSHNDPQLGDAKCKTLGRSGSMEKKDPDYNLVAVWGREGTENALGLPEDLSPDRIDL